MTDGGQTRYDDQIAALTRTAGAAPEELWRLLEAIRSVAGDSETLVLTGSLAVGSGDAVSDIDLDALCADSAARDMLKRRIDRCLRDQGRMLAQFPATHLGLPDLVISFVEIRGTLVKVDVHYRLYADVRTVPAMPDLGGLYSRFTGWLWYTHTKIARGEYWEAADSIAVMRGQALLPILLFVRDLPVEGHRRLEARLSRADLQRLANTHPKELHAEALRAALKTLCDTFEPLAAAAATKVGHDFRAADLPRMRHLAEI